MVILAALPALTAVTVSANGAKPDRPTGLTATLVTSGVELSWNDPEDGSITHHRIFRKEVSATRRFSLLENNTGNADASYTDETARDGTTYAYRVQAVNAVGRSPRSKATRATTPSEAPTRMSPASVVQEQSQGQGQGQETGPVTVGWTPVDGATGYQVSRQTYLTGEEAT